MLTLRKKGTVREFELKIILNIYYALKLLKINTQQLLQVLLLYIPNLGQLYCTILCATQV